MLLHFNRAEYLRHKLYDLENPKCLFSDSLQKNLPAPDPEAIMWLCVQWRPCFVSVHLDRGPQRWALSLHEVCRGGRSSERTTAGGKVRPGSHTHGVKFCLHTWICSVKGMLSPSLSVYEEDVKEKWLPHRATITNNLDKLNEEVSLVPGKCSRNVFALLGKWKHLAKTPRSVNRAGLPMQYVWVQSLDS